MLFKSIEVLSQYNRVDICIIGSGIGGSSLAKKLAENGHSFVIVEAGDFSGKSSSNVNYENIGRDFGVRTTTTIQVGGTSNLWHGVLAPLDKMDFEQRDYIPYSGWAINLDDLLPYYAQAGQVLGVEQFDYYDKANLPTDLLEQLESLPFNRSLLKNKIFQQKVPPHNFKQTIKELCEKSEQFHCLYDTTALELIYENGKISSLKIGLSDGSTAEISAKCFIIASGALQTPRLLLNSKIDNKNIGKFLMDHPMGNLCQIELKEPKSYPIYSDTSYGENMKIKTGLELQDDIQQERKLPNHNFYLRPSFIKGIDNQSEKVKLSLLAFKDKKMTFKDLLNVILHPNVIRQILVYKYSLNVKLKYADLFFVTEQVPNPNSYVKLSEKKDKWGYPISSVNWQVCEQDIASVKAYFNMVLTEFFPHEHYHFTHSLNDFNWEEIFTSAIHHVGTARMGHSAENGVVDKNLQVFGFDNLYICDGSIFTTAGNVNNGLSICAFACRLAEHLGEKMS